MAEKYTPSSRNKSGISGELDMTREEARAIKKMAEAEMRRRGSRNENTSDEYVFPLGGDTWADLMHIRRKCKRFLRENQ